jgi:hypothetical protein
MPMNAGSGGVWLRCGVQVGGQAQQVLSLLVGQAVHEQAQLLLAGNALHGK